MDKTHVREQLKHNGTRLLAILKWTVFSLLSGAALGLIGALFYRGIGWATTFRQSHYQVLFLLPAGAVVIRFLYHLLRDDKDGGTNLVLSAIHSGDRVPLRMSPLIIISTIFSHLVGASVGREGAALQLGGSIGDNIGRLLKFKERDRQVMVMVGMSGVFSALFGTPIAAAVFSMEVVSVGIMHYAALMPCVLSAFTARAVARYFGAPDARFAIGEIPAFSLEGAWKIALLGVFCGLIAALFCVCLHRGSAFFKGFIKNGYIRALVFGTIVLGLTFLVGDQTYNGAGVDYINACISGDDRPAGFLMKILFTVLSIIAGYKGGEIVPSFFIGASFGCTFGKLFAFSPALCAAVGMGTVFCGVTNCPLSSFLICCELFGFDGALYFMPAIAFSYLFSGYSGLYSSQRIVFSKYRFNHRKTDDA